MSASYRSSSNINRHACIDEHRNLSGLESPENSDSLEIMASDSIDTIYKSLRLLPEFDGNPHILTRFINLCDQLVITHFKVGEGHELSNLALLNGILNKVTGPAARLINSNGIPENWIGIRNALINNFADHRDETALYNDLSLQTQGSSSPQEFYERCQSLFSTIMTYITLHEPVQTTVEAKRSLYQKLTLQCYLRGLKDPLGSRIRCMRPESMEKALCFVQEELNTLYIQQRNEGGPSKKDWQPQPPDDYKKKVSDTNLQRHNSLLSWRQLKTECESPEIRMALPCPARAPDPTALEAYWAEYEDLCRQIGAADDDDNNYEEGELETEWLQAAGLGSLAAPFQAGLEVTEAQLGEAVRPLPREQAAAVRRRVRRLNRTVRRKRAASRARKPDIRDVFRDLENSSGSEPRSRSATPDSLDSLPSGGSGSPPAEWADNATPPDFVDSFPGVAHAPLARTPSAPAAPRRTRLSPPAPSPPLPMHELFKPNDLHWADIATNTEGIELLGYQRYGTVQGPRIGKERINGSILKDNDLFINNKHAAVSRAKSAAAVQQPLSFEHKFNLDRQMMVHEEEWPEEDSTVDIESFTEPQLKRLPPLLWLELTALFDRYSLPFQKRKPPKKKRKEEGNVFGVSLETLVRKDMILWEETASAPAVVRALAGALRRRTDHEGLLRVPGNKHKIEALCDIVERQWYSDRGAAEAALAHAAAHDVAAVFKRLLRALPQPPLTQELMRLFYHTYALPGRTAARALNLLVLLLPAEQRATLRELLRLARHIAARHVTNKMTDHNVAMIIAPALFPPSLLIKPTDSLETQLATAANSCHVTEALMRWCDQLWVVPASLYEAVQRKPPPHRRNHHT